MYTTFSLAILCMYKWTPEIHYLIVLLLQGLLTELTFIVINIQYIQFVNSWKSIYWKTGSTRVDAKKSLEILNPKKLFTSIWTALEAAQDVVFAQSWGCVPASIQDTYVPLWDRMEGAWLWTQVITKRCRPSWLTKSALRMRGGGGGGVQPKNNLDTNFVLQSWNEPSSYWNIRK